MRRLICTFVVRIWHKTHFCITWLRLFIRVSTICYSIWIFWLHYWKVKPHCSNFTIITTFTGCPNFWDFYSRNVLSWWSVFRYSFQYFSLNKRHDVQKMSHLMRLWYFLSSVNSFSNTHAQPSSEARCLIFDWTLCLLPTSCVRTAKALARLHGCTCSPEPSLVAYVIRPKI